MESPWLSIIIPVYNVEDYLKQCLESILVQSCGDIEIILVNDGSTDNSGQICDAYAEEYDTITVVHKINGGLSSARNSGLNIAKGEYLWWVDSDDFIIEESISLLKKLLINYDKELDVLGFSFKTLDKNNILEAYNKKVFLKPINGEKFLQHYERVSVWVFLYKRTLILNNNIKFNSDVKIFEDNIFNIQVFNKSSQIVQTNHHLYIYRINREGSLMNVENHKKNLNSVIVILHQLNTINLDVITKQTLNRVKVSFWGSFLYFFDKVKPSYSKKELILFSKEKFNLIGVQNINNHKDISMKIDIFFNNLLRKRYLNYRSSSKLILIKKIIYKSNLILNKVY